VTFRYNYEETAMTISRRAVLAASAAAALVAGPSRAASKISIRLNPQSPLSRIPADFMGLGYEALAVATPGLLSATNRTYVQLVRNLGRQGVIRIGGNVSDFSAYKADGPSATGPKATVLSAENIRQLRTFLDATGWKLIWGLNLGSNDLDNAVEEARIVVETMGHRLLALEVGNEPDLFVAAGHRKAPYDYTAWHADYRRYKAAIRAALPNAPFAGPDLAGATSWMASFARDEGTDLALLTAHHYIAGQANPASTIELMLREEKKYQPALAEFQAISAQTHLPYRLCETASFSGGGKADVSDTFAAALWALDYLFVLASRGCSGVNMETGVNHLGWVSHYTPISDDLAGHHDAAPEYYGLLAFAQFAGAEQIAVTCDASDVNLAAYGVIHGGGRLSLAIINKDFGRDAVVEIANTTALRTARTMRLTAPSLSAKEGITLGGSQVGADGSWSGGSAESVKVQAGRVQLSVAAGSAALLGLTTTG
jgi:hypothetical protein